MDWTFAEGTGRGEQLKGKMALTLYQLDGDTSRFFAARQEGRPGGCHDKEGVNKYVYLVLRRVKEHRLGKWIRPCPRPSQNRSLRSWSIFFATRRGGWCPC